MFKVNIDKKEVMRYCGCKKSDEVFDEKFNRCKSLCLKTIRPNFTARKFVLKNGNPVGADIEFIGNDVKQFLSNKDFCFIFAATIGHGFEAELLKLMITSPSESLIFDACGTAAVESLCDKVCLSLAGKTDRFSCGYGDFPIDLQQKFISALSADKLLGISVNADFMLSPCKSVTAVIGSSNCENGSDNSDGENNNISCGNEYNGDDIEEKSEYNGTGCDRKCKNCLLKTCSYRSK